MYRWSLPPDTAPLAALVDALDRQEIDAVAFTNAEQVRNLFTVADQRGRAAALESALNRTLVASIGPVCSQALAERGVRYALEQPAEARRADDGARESVVGVTAQLLREVLAKNCVGTC